MGARSVRLPLAVLLLLAVVLLFASGDAEAIDPEWNYTTGDEVRTVAVSADGEYIAAGSNDNKVYLFDKDSSTPLWSYTIGSVVYSVAISADGEYIVAGSDNDARKVYLFDKDSSTPLWNYTTGNFVNSVAISADGEYIAVGSADAKVYLFDKDSSTPLWSYTTGSDVYPVVISADGEYIVAGTHDGEVYLFDKDSSTPLWSYTTEDYVYSVAISADGEYIVAGSYDDKVYLFDKDSSTPLWSYTTGDDVLSVSISADGEYIVAGSYDDKVYLFGKDSSTPLWNYTTGSETVQSVAITADGEYITVGSRDNKVYLFDKDSSTPLWSYTTGGDVDAVAISADGKHLVAGSDDDNIYTFKNNLTSRPSLLTYGPRSGSNTDTDPQLGWFAGSDDRSNLTFDVYLDTDSDPSTKVADDITIFYYNLQCLDKDTKYYWKVVATDGDDTVTSSIMNFTVTMPGSIFCISIDDGEYDPDDLTITVGGTVIWTNNDDSLHTVTSDDDDFDSGTIGSGNSWSYTFNATGTYDYHCEYHGSMTGTIEVVVSYKPTATIDSISPQISELYNSTSFSGHGNDTDGTIAVYLWTSSIDGELSTEASFSTADLTFGNHTITFRVEDNDGVWSDDVTSWVDVRKTPEWSYTTGDDVSSVAISADGEYIAAGPGWDEKVYLFDKDSGTPIWSHATGSVVSSVAISADGEYIAAGSFDDKVYLFNKDSSTPLWNYTTGYSVLSVAISADGEYIAVGSGDNKVYLFDRESSTPLWSYSTSDYVVSTAISADGEYIVAGSQDDKVYLFHKSSSTPLWSHTTENYVRSVAISADGEYITAGSEDDKVYLFHKDSSTPLWSYTTGDYVLSVAISADGEYIAVGSLDDKVYLIDKDNSTPLWSYNTGHDVYSVDISADGEYIAAGSLDNEVYLFNKDSSTPLWSYTTGDYVFSVAISADGEYIVAGSRDDKVYAFRNDPVSRPSVIPYGPRSGSEILPDTTLGWFPGSDDIVNLTFDVYLSWIKTDVENNNSAARVADDISNYTFSVSGLTEGKTHYWKVVATDTTGSTTSRIMEFYVLDTTGPITNITSGPSDPTGYSNATFTFTANENDVTFKCKVDTGDWSNCTSPVSYYNLSRGDYHLFQVKGTDDSGNEGEEDDWMWEILENEKPTASIDSISPQIADLDGEVSFSGSGEDEDGTIVAYLWTSSIDGTLSSSANFTINDLSFGNHTITFMVKDNEGDWSDEVTSWVDVRKMPEWSYETQADALDVSISEDGEYLVAGSMNNKLYLFRKNSSNPVWTYTNPNSERIQSVDISANGEYIVAGSHDNNVYLFNKNSSNPVWTYEAGGEIGIVEISANGEYTIAGSDDNKIYLFSRDSGTPIWEYAFDDNVKSISISANGEYIVAGSWADNGFSLFNKNSNTPIWESDLGSMFQRVAISADGEYITASDQNRIYLFSKDSNEPLWSYYVQNDVMSLSISADGEYLVGVNSGHPDNKIYLFDKDSSTPLWTYNVPRLLSVSISADGQYIVAGSRCQDLDVCSGTGSAGLYFFTKESNVSVWKYLVESDVNAVSISADGGYISAGSKNSDTYSDKVFVFENSATSRPSVIPYGPRSGSEVPSNTTLRWFPGSDDIANLTFAVYLDTDNASTRIANDITDYHYTVSDLSEEGTYYWKIVATDNTGTATSQVMNFTVADTTPPLVDINSGPDSVTRATIAIFYFTSNEDDSTFECALDGGDWSNCGSGGNSTYYSGLGLGDHTFAVKATDPSNNTGEPTYWEWIIRSQYVVYIEDGEYNSSYIEIEQGDAVTWVNNDDTLHTVTADDDMFNSGGLGPGDEWSYYFDDMGSYDYHCEYHESMNGTVFVEEQSASGNEPPTVWNVTISPNPAYENEWVYFSAEWNDTDGYVVAFEWWSDHDGLLSTNDSFDSTNLSVANHNIIFRVQDNDGAWSENGTVGLVILSDNASNDPPEVWNVTISPNPAYEDEWVYFSAEWNDTDGYVVAFEWWSDHDGLLSTNSSFDSDTLSVADHNIIFRVQDNDGAWSENGTVVLVILEEKEESGLPWSYTTGDGVDSVAISADGEYIVAGSGDKKVYLFDKDSNIPLWSYETGSFVLCVDISADGEYIVAGSWDDKVYLFHKDGSTPLWNYTTGDWVYSVAISADGKYIAAGSVDNTVYLFDKDSSTPLWNYTTGNNVYSVAISADGEYIVAGSYDGEVYLFHKNSSTPLWSYDTWRNVYPVVISADGEYIVAGTHDGEVYLFGKDSSTPLWNYTTGSETVQSVAITADGEYITVGSRDNKVYLFDKDSSTPLWSYKTGHDVYSVAISADGEYIAAGSFDGRIYLFNEDSSTPVWNYDTDYYVYAVAISADGEHLTAGSNDNKVYAFKNTASGNESGNDPPAVWNLDVGPNPAYEDERVYFSAEWNDTDGYVAGFQWLSDIDGLLSTGDSYDSNDLSVGDHTISFRVRDNDGAWSEYALAELVILPLDEAPVLYLTSTKNSAVEYIATVEYVGIEYPLRYFSYFLKDSSGTTNEFGEIAMQNLSGNAVGIDVSYDKTCGEACNADLQARSDAVDTDSGATYAVTFSDNDRDGKLSAGDTFTVRGTGHSFDGPAQDEWSLEVWFGTDTPDNSTLAGSLILGEPVTEYPAGHWFMLPDMTLSNDVDRLSNSSSIKYVAATYDQGPGIRTNREQVLVGEWELGESPVEQEITFVDTQIWFIGLDPDYEADCKWEFKVLVDGAIAAKTMRNCASNGDYLVMESYNLSLSVNAGAGQEISIEVWYEGWEDINFYHGSLKRGSGFNISGFQSESTSGDGREEHVDISPGTPVTLNTWEDLGLLLELVVGEIASGNITVTSVDVPPPLPDDATLKDVGIYISITIDLTIQDYLNYANVTLRFDINILPDGVSADTLRVYHYSEEDGWEISETGGMDRENGTVWGHFTNFSVFAVFGSNAAPVADAGPDLQVTPGSQAVFFGSAVDADGYITLYEWDFDGDGVFDYSSSDGIASHVFDEEGSYLVTLRVTDNEGSTGFDETVVTVGESSSFAFLDSPLFRIFFPTVILLLAVGYYAYRKYGTFGAGAFGAQKSKFELKKEEDVTVVCPACGIDMKVPRLGTLQLVICDNCGNEGEMEV